MTKITTYNCEQIDSPRLFISNFHEYLQREDSYLHLIRGAFICFCRQGDAVITVNYSTYHLHADDILIILPTHVVGIEQSSTDVVIEAIMYSDEYWVSLARTFDYKLLKIVEQSPFMTLSGESREDVLMLLNMLHKHDAETSEGDTGETLKRSLAGGLAFSILMLVISILDKEKTYTSRPVTRKEMLTHDFFALLSQHYETERKVSFYASKLCVTPKHLSTMVKEVTHLSIQEWINNVTVLNIKHHLLTTTDTVQQISEKLNFQTPSTFIRYFRHHTGMTPYSYRANNQKI